MPAIRLRGPHTLPALLVLLLMANPASAQRDNSSPRPSPNAAVSQTIGTTVVDLHYSRPGVKGRNIFGGLQPWGQVWRAGANEPTTITFSKDVMVEGQPLPAGSYALWITPMENGAWDVIFGDLVGWGTQYDPTKDVLKVSATPENAPAQEWLMYRFEDLSATGATLVMHWDAVRLPIRITTAGA